MTGAAGFTLFHILHACCTPAARFAEHHPVAVLALVHTQVEIVTEYGRTDANYLVGHIFCRMAGRALFQAESFLLVMAGTAGLPFFHGSHSYRAVWTCLEYSAMAVFAFLPRQMRFVAEGYRSDILAFQ